MMIADGAGMGMATPDRARIGIPTGILILVDIQGVTTIATMIVIVGTIVAMIGGMTD